MSSPGTGGTCLHCLRAAASQWSSSTFEPHRWRDICVVTSFVSSQTSSFPQISFLYTHLNWTVSASLKHPTSTGYASLRVHPLYLYLMLPQWNQPQNQTSISFDHNLHSSSPRHFPPWFSPIRATLYMYEGTPSQWRCPSTNPSQPRSNSIVWCSTTKYPVDIWHHHIYQIWNKAFMELEHNVSDCLVLTMLSSPLTCCRAVLTKRTAVEEQVNIHIIFLFGLLASLLGSIIGTSINTVSGLTTSCRSHSWFGSEVPLHHGI